MIPSEEQAKALWDKYNLPEKKRIHVSLVCRVALYFARECQKKIPNLYINIPLLRAACLLHDIDKAIPGLPGELHPDAGVRVLREAGMDEVADVVKTHSLYAIFDVALAPHTWEQKLLYIADKMVKLAIISVDERFRLWKEEHLPPDAQAKLDASYPRVKEMEKEITDLIGIQPEDVAKLA